MLELLHKAANCRISELCASSQDFLLPFTSRVIVVAILVLGFQHKPEDTCNFGFYPRHENMMPLHCFNSITALSIAIICYNYMRYLIHSANTYIYIYVRLPNLVIGVLIFLGAKSSGIVRVSFVLATGLRALASNVAGRRFIHGLFL